MYMADRAAAAASGRPARQSTCGGNRVASLKEKNVLITFYPIGLQELQRFLSALSLGAFF